MIEVLKLALTDAKRNERHNNVAETRYWLNQYKLIAEQAIAQLALDAKAENAKELGLDYEPEPSFNEWTSDYVRDNIHKLKAQRTWVGLTDDEMEATFIECGGKWNGDFWKIEDADFHPFLRTIEAKLKEKNT